MLIKLKEHQLFAFIHFLNYTGLFNTFRLGVLKTIMDKEFHLDSSDIKDYIELYHKYLKFKDKGNRERLDAVRSYMWEIEKNYRTDIVYYLRKIINERHYGLKK